MNAEEKVAFLALNALGGVGYWTLRALRERHGSFAAVVALDDRALATALDDAGAKRKRADNGEVLIRPSLAEGARRLAYLRESGMQLIMSGSADFPSSFRELAEPPYWLFVEGNIELLHRSSLAIVGTRTPSADGMFLAAFVGACLAQIEAPTVSGLALGIDTLIHEASLRYRVPTIAVLGTGILQDYPRGSKALRQRIITAGGAVISEYLPRDSFSRDSFVRRNRLQAALGRVLIPVEWKINSGTAHTVRYAQELRRTIVCLRMPDWLSDHPELMAAEKAGVRTFTIPGDEAAFRSAVTDALREQPHSKNSNASEQLSLWLEIEAQSSDKRGRTNGS